MGGWDCHPELVSGSISASLKDMLVSASVKNEITK